MSIDQTTPTTETTQATKTLDSPDLSFHEYVEIRNGKSVPVTEKPKSEENPSAPGAKAPEQKKSEGSESSEADEKEDEPTDESDAEGDEPKADDEAEKDDKPKKKSGYQRRVDKLNARVSAAQQEADFWKREAQKSATEPKKEPVESKPAQSQDGKPKPEDFEDHAEWVEAVADWKAEQKLKERDQKLERSKLEDDQRRVVSAYAARAKSFAAKTPDYQEALEDVEHIRVSPVVQAIILESENGPELAYALAKKPEEFARINALSPVAAAREIGKFEASLSKPSAESKQSETKKITQAPKPIEPVSGGQAKVAKSIDDPDLPFPEYVKLRREQLKRKGA